MILISKQCKIKLRSLSEKGWLKFSLVSRTNGSYGPSIKISELVKVAQIKSFKLDKMAQRKEILSPVFSSKPDKYKTPAIKSRQRPN